MYTHSFPSLFLLLPVLFVPTQPLLSRPTTLSSSRPLSPSSERSKSARRSPVTQEKEALERRRGHKRPSDFEEKDKAKEEEEEDEYLDWSPAEEATSDDDSEGSHLSYRKLREWKSELERLRSQKSASKPTRETRGGRAAAAAAADSASESDSESESESESSSVAEMADHREEAGEGEGEPARLGKEKVRKSAKMQVALAQKQAAKVIEAASVLEGVQKAEAVGLKPVDQLKVSATPKQTAPQDPKVIADRLAMASKPIPGKDAVLDVMTKNAEVVATMLQSAADDPAEALMAKNKIDKIAGPRQKGADVVEDVVGVVEEAADEVISEAQEHSGSKGAVAVDKTPLDAQVITTAQAAKLTAESAKEAARQQSAEKASASSQGRGDRNQLVLGESKGDDASAADGVPLVKSSPQPGGLTGKSRLTFEFTGQELPGRGVDALMKEMPYAAPFELDREVVDAVNHTIHHVHPQDEQ